MTMRRMNVTLARVVVVVLLLWVQVQLYFSSLGYARYQEIRQQVITTEQLVQQVEAENTMLADTVDNLKGNDVLLTHNAREHLGMIGPGETMYRVTFPEKSLHDSPS